MRIGVVGAGKIGRLRIRSILEEPTAELAAVLDVSPERAAAAVAGGRARPCTDMQTFLDTGLDAVVVSTPPHLHQEICLAAFGKGCHVLCEKPLAHTVDAARSIVDAALGAGRKLAVGFNMRYYPFVKFARAAVDRGDIGNIAHIRISGGHDGLHNFSADWQYRMPESGGGAMMDVGIHMTDLARYFLGEITTVYGHASESVWNLPGSEDNAMALFRNPQGTAASYQATWAEWKGYRSVIEVYGDDGMVRGSYAPMQNLLLTRTRNGRRRKIRRFYPEIMLREKVKTWQDTALRSFREELADFLKRLRGEGDGPLADGYDGLRAVEIASAVRSSERAGAPVTLDVLGKMP